jgi:gamma-glutamyltranspeptidase/glutathione hydrolase
MGGDVQVQGHAQVPVNIFELSANLQAAGDMACFRRSQVSNRLELESELFKVAGAQLRSMGHDAVSVDGRTMGGISLSSSHQRPKTPRDRKAITAGTDHCKDGEAVGW